MIDKLKEEEIILPSSDQAATYKTNISGWVSKKGHFYGKDERLARWDGSTHSTCDQCKKVIEKGRAICNECHAKNNNERYKAKEYKEWDHSTPVYSETLDKYFFDEDEIVCFLEDQEVGEEMGYENLDLVICEPNHLRYVDEDYFEDVFPDDGDGELPAPLAFALEEFNKAIEDYNINNAISWSPGKFKTKYEGYDA